MSFIRTRMAQEYEYKTFKSCQNKFFGTIILALMISSMIIIFHIHSEKILILMCQDPKIAKISGDFIILFIPAEICYFLYTCLTKYLQNQNYVIPNVITMFLTNILNIILHITFLQFTNLRTQ
ncbi:hypothetical protein A3Q56_03692 [Intoshia linei]|uniref:G-protein coupled receptors family 1 profile domain-containing protein n=1 Tax=Intoshia linei TaxID=1819745 RepID=A0A177B2T7_9BILA|nr:hypothetical protein A3Q56_03692 [Intoshia linei]